MGSASTHSGCCCCCCLLLQRAAAAAAAGSGDEVQTRSTLSLCVWGGGGEGAGSKDVPGTNQYGILQQNLVQSSFRFNHGFETEKITTICWETGLFLTHYQVSSRSSWCWQISAPKKKIRAQRERPPAAAARRRRRAASAYPLHPNPFSDELCEGSTRP